MFRQASTCVVYLLNAHKSLVPVDIARLKQRLMKFATPYSASIEVTILSKVDAPTPADRQTWRGTDGYLSCHRVCVIVRICTFLGEIYEHTKKLDTRRAARFTRRSRYIPILVKNYDIVRRNRQKLFRSLGEAGVITCLRFDALYLWIEPFRQI